MTGRFRILPPQVPPARPADAEWRPPRVIPSDADWPQSARVPIFGLPADPGGWGQTSKVAFPANFSPSSRVVLQNKINPDGRNPLKTFCFGLTASAEAEGGGAVVPQGVDAFVHLKFGVGGGVSDVFVDVGQGVQITVPATFWSVQAFLTPGPPSLVPTPIVKPATPFLVSCSVAEGTKFVLGQARRTLQGLIPGGGGSVVFSVPPFADRFVVIPLTGPSPVGLTLDVAGNFTSSTYTVAAPLQEFPIVMDQAIVTVTNPGAVAVPVALAFLLTV